MPENHYKPTDSVLLNTLLKKFDQYNRQTKAKESSDAKFFQSLLEIKELQPIMKGGDLSVLDKELADVSVNLFSAKTDDYLGKVRLYAGFQQFLYRLREEIRKKLGIKEEIFYLKAPGRIISPDLRAFEYMGNNSLDIRESPNAYDMVFN